MLSSLMMKNALKSIAVLMSLTASAQAGPDVTKIGTPTYAGTGCKAGTGKATLDGGTLRLSVTPFVVQPKSGALARGSCNVSVPVHIDAGHQIALRALTLTGHTQLSTDAKARVSTELFFAGSRGKLTTEDLPPKNSALQVSYRPADSDLEWSACGAQPIARVNSSFTLQSNTPTDSIRVDMLTLEMISRKCP
jgi:hypothetical protein